MGTIIWDWNGTLLNDLDFCITTINHLLKKRDLTLLDRKFYKEVFSFPVKDYYRAIGFDFDKEDFAIPAREFIDLYNGGVENCHLHPSAIEILTHFNKSGNRQFVLSAMKQDMLEQTLRQNSLFHFFEGVYGLNDHYAASKVERGKQLIEIHNIRKKEAWIIGDTLHDHEVAVEMGINCILIADGHQSESRLKSSGTTVISDLSALRNMRLVNQTRVADSYK